MPNIRFSDEGFNSLKEFCKKRGYKLGQFCENAAIEKLDSEIITTISKGFKPVEIKKANGKVSVRDLTKENSVGKVYNPFENKRFTDKNKVQK